MTAPPPEQDAASAVAAHPRWYHTMELEPGVVTPGWFDLRPIVDRLPWPDVTGERCLDVGPYDGFFSFELERRGAAEVVAADIGSTRDWDWPLRARSTAPEHLTQLAGPDPGAGFAIAKRALGSHVERVELSAYDLSPERIGRFDVVVCGSLLLHLRDPIAALEAMRSVCDGHLLSAEAIEPSLALLGRPTARLRGDRSQWWIPNPRAHRLMLRVAGFEIVGSIRPYAIPLGDGHPASGATVRPRLRKRILQRLVAGGPGVPHVAVLARPDREIE